MTKLYEKTFTLQNDIQSISTHLNDMLGYIESCSIDESEAHATLLKAKWVIVEMLTNAIKHSGTSEARIKIICNETQLIIEKTDNGAALKLAVHNSNDYLTWPLKNIPQDTIDVYADEMHRLHCKIKGNGDVTFFADAQKADISSFEIENLPEHFGLLIITRSCDEFTYSYDVASKANLFRCIINKNKV